MTSYLVPALRRFAVAAVLAAAPVVAEAADDGLELKRVVLSTGGVAYMEYEATVDGDASLTFDVGLDQVDDVLKSFIVLDDKGGVGTVTLPGRQPLAEVFRDLPFDAAALSSTVDLLRALTGEEVAVEGDVDITGKILSVTDETVLGDDGASLRHRLALATEGGIRQAIVEDATSIRFTDAGLQQQIDSALVALATHRIADRRTLTLQTTGDDERIVRLGYVVAAPLWKTTYRLALGEGATALLQGWATLENMSGQDWNGVELTLVSGNPVTFRQALYESYWVERPWVPVDVAGRVVPMVDGGAMNGVLSKAQEEAFYRSQDETMDMLSATSGSGGLMAMEEVAAAPTQMAGMAGAVTEEAATQVVFRIADPVNVASGESLSVPIVSRTVPAQMIALYQPSSDARHPLAAVRLTNDSGAGLPPGVVTIYQPSAASGGEAFVGDARLGVLPVGEDRLVAFALDQRTLVDREDKSSQTIAKLTIDRGVLTTTIVNRQTTLYAVQAPQGEDLQVLIEHPRMEGWELAKPPGEVETTQTDYRLPLAVPAGQSATLEVVLERQRLESMQLVDMGRDQLVWYADNGKLSQDARTAFARIAELRAAIDQTDRAVDEANRQRSLILQEQERLRDNLASVPSGSDLADRYLTKLAEQEDLIEQQLSRLDDLAAQRESRQQALRDFVAGLKI